MRDKFGSSARGTAGFVLLSFGHEVCQAFQDGQSVTDEVKSMSIPIGWVPPHGMALQAVTLAGKGNCPDWLRAAQHLAAKQARQAKVAAAARREAKRDAAARATAAAAARRLANTVSYVVTGSEADVTYGPSGSDFQGSVPMNVSAHLGNPLYYAISAQLQGDGQVSCAILVGGKVISSATATGGYNIATCEISQDPLYGGWTDTNGG